MNSLWQHLGNEHVQELIKEWMDLHTSGTVDLGDPGQAALRPAVDGLFVSLAALVSEHQTLMALEQDDSPTIIPDADQLVQQAREMCTNEALGETITTLCLLRRKVHAAALDLRDEAAILTQLEGIVGLLPRRPA